MRDGVWSLEVLVDGTVQPEHTVEGHTCIEARPGKQFKVRVTYHGAGMHQIDLLVDGKSASGRKMVDATGTTSHPRTEVSFDGFVKRKDAEKVTSAFVYEQSRATDSDGAGEDAGSGLASAPVDWSRGLLALRIYRGYRQVVAADTNAADHNPDMSRAAALSEKAMIKGGHSASVASGSKCFSATTLWRAGESYVDAPLGDAPEQELRLYYRDSFFLLLRGDESKVVDKGAEGDASQSSDSAAKVRANVRRLADTAKQLAKRPKLDAVIDLTGE